MRTISRKTNVRATGAALPASGVRRLIGLGATLLALSAPATAKIVEDTVELPVTVSDVQGRTLTHTIKVTIFRDDARAVSPFLVLNHGRSRKAEEREKLGRARFTENSRYFVSKGFVVFVPTRIGYGVTGGEDVENSGKCSAKNYPPVYEAAAQQSIAVIDYAKKLRYVDKNRGLVVGQSFGGMTAVALAAKNLPGVVAAINFAGGAGGNPVERPENPCRDDLIVALFSDYGRTSRIPTLWLYSENDRYFGKEKPKAWFDGFRTQGGVGEFVGLPPLETEKEGGGHASFTSNPKAWHPAVEAFLKRNGFQ